MRASSLAFVGSVAAQSSNFLPSNPGGAIPAGVQAPSIYGFQNSTIQPSRGGLAVCVSGIVPVQASAMNMNFTFPVPQNQSAVTETFAEFITSGSPFMKQIAAGARNVSGLYNISATYCTPGNNTKPSTVQILSHGVGFDRYYWDFAPGYSYVDVAASYNHATFFYDRLGVGQSSKPDGINTVQTPLELEILHQLITKLKNGAISNSTFTNIVGTGHSFGSILTEGITAKYPTDLSTAILTGFSLNSTGMPAFTSALGLQIASQNSPYRFSGLNNSYLVVGNTIGNQLAFMRGPDFDPLILHAADAQKGTVTFGELFTTMAVVKPASNFTGNVAVVNGANDLPFCTGNCSYPTNLAQAAITSLYPNASHSFTYLAPVTGHGVNLHYTAVTAYHYIQEFIKNNTASSS